MSTTPAGTQPTAPAADPAAAQPSAGDPPAAAAPAAPAAPAQPAAPAPAADEPLGEGGVKALERERELRAEAERKAATEKKRADDLAAEKLSDADKLEKRATDGDAKFGQGTEKLRRANLIMALQEKGLAGGKAKAAAKLISVEYDDSDEPKELDNAITAAKAEYGEELFQVGATPPAPPDPNGDPNGNGTPPANPDLHQGPRPTDAEAEEAAAIQALTTGMQTPTGASNPLSILDD